MSLILLISFETVKRFVLAHHITRAWDTSSQESASSGIQISLLPKAIMISPYWKLTDQLNFTSSIQPITLPNSDTEIEDGTICLVSGWGKANSILFTQKKKSILR